MCADNKDKLPHILIACHGLPGSGKDTFANHLIRDGGNWSKVSFAAPIKRGLSAMFNIPMEDIENPNIKNSAHYKFERSIRYMAQTLGTEWGRVLIKDSVWVDLAQEGIEHAWNKGQSVVNTDLRFENEAKRVKDLGGFIVHIIRDDNKFDSDNKINEAVNHASNITLDEKYIDFVIFNNGTIDEFQSDITKVIKEITKGAINE